MPHCYCLFQISATRLTCCVASESPQKSALPTVVVSVKCPTVGGSTTARPSLSRFLDHHYAVEFGKMTVCKPGVLGARPRDQRGQSKSSTMSDEPQTEKTAVYICMHERGVAKFVHTTPSIHVHWNLIIFNDPCGPNYCRRARRVAFRFPAHR